MIARASPGVTQEAGVQLKASLEPLSEVRPTGAPKESCAFLVLLGMAVSSAGLAACSQNSSPAASPVPPTNVLLIVLDDVGSDKLSLFDRVSAPPYARTPRLDALAAGGIRFTSYSTQTLCSTSRACIQTGRYPLRTGMGTNTEVWELPDSELLIAELLELGLPPQRAYRSGAFGKWHVGRRDPGHAVDNGYERFYGTLGNTTDHFVWSKIEHDAGSTPSDPILVSAWSPSVVRADAVRWISAQQRPFFAYVAFNPPHLVPVPAPSRTASTSTSAWSTRPRTSRAAAFRATCRSSITWPRTSARPTTSCSGRSLSRNSRRSMLCARRWIS